MRRPLITQSDFMNVGARLVEAINANADELAYVEAYRSQLESMLIDMRELMAQQDALTASKQTVSKRIKATHEEGIKLVNYLRRTVQQHYGTRNEKLVEFGVQPFRGRPRPVETSVTPPTVPTPPTTPPPTVE